MEKEKQRIPYVGPEVRVIMLERADIVTASGGSLSWSVPDSDDGGWT